MSSKSYISSLVPLSKPKAKKARRGLSMPLGLQRYINTRGTPKGTYELVRTVHGYFDHSPSGITIGAAAYEAGTFVIDPTTLTLFSGVAGNSATWSIPNSSELAALWDKVKIDKVEFTFYETTAAATNSGTAQLPMFVFAEDDNDRFCSLASVQQMDCKTWQPGFNNSKMTIVTRPRYQRIVYYTSVTSSYEPTRGYVVSDTAIPHYGLKVAIAQTSAASNGGRVNFSAKVYFKLKELK